MYDVAIIGTGPAAVSAALNLKLHNKSIVWFGPSELSRKVEKSEKIANYPGVPMVTGPELNNMFHNQIDEMGIEIQDKMVTAITKTGKGYMVLGGNDIYDAKTVLLTIGAASAKGYPGEEELLGSGVSYCATCDGYLYKGKTIAVFCGDKRFEHEVEYLSELAEKVILFTPYKDCEIDLPNVVRGEKPMKEICGADRVERIRLTDNSEIPVDGVFILRNSVAPATLLRGLESDGAHIKVDRDMNTNKAGCFAAGDCTGRPYQIAKAVGEGNIAAHSIVEYLGELEKKQQEAKA
ncbi:MAG: NAD(P)/FAD-dependent oxidoreductase [Eubacteriaceae bacterium]|nr:NAD(P)/FAD-dependent oxidoreductase [Eubacteriaceae bacterium]